MKQSILNITIAILLSVSVTTGFFLYNQNKSGSKDVSSSVDVESVAQSTTTTVSAEIATTSSEESLSNITPKTIPPSTNNNQQSVKTPILPTATTINQPVATDSTTTQSQQEPEYDYQAMREFTDKLDGFLVEDAQANQTFGMSQKAGNSGNYPLAVTYAEDALAVYDSLLERNRELVIPQSTPTDVRGIMQQAIQMHLTHINNFKKPAQIHLSVMRELEEDGLASQSARDSYDDAIALSNQAYQYAQTVFLPKLAELNASVEKYKPN